MDLRDTSQPKKLVLELWFNFWFEILDKGYLSKKKKIMNKCLGFDVVGVNLVIAAFDATLVCILWIC